MKPQALPVDSEGIPEGLRASPRWAAWKYSLCRRTQRYKKVPVNCTTSRNAAVDDPGDWTTFDAALAFYREHGLAGVGFLFVEEDGFCGIDLDACREPGTGMLEQWAWDIVGALDSYTEVSPSGKGVHILVRGRPEACRRKGGVETYFKGRYFALTGVRVPGTPPYVAGRQRELDAFYRKVFATPRGAPDDRALSYNGLKDDDVVARARTSANGERFGALWDGDWEKAGCPSQSEADLALSRMLAFWVGPDAERVDRIFRQSGLMREKWNAVHSADGRTYGEMTVELAVRSQKEHYHQAGLLLRNTQETQEHSETPGNYNTGCGLPYARLHADDLEQAVRMAVGLADEKGGLPDGEAEFALARRLHQLTSDHPEQFKAAVQAYAERTGREVEPFWYAFLAVWDKVRTAEGDDVIEWAAKKAEDEPYTPYPCLGAVYARVASIAWHLSRLRGEKPFWLPLPRLADLLKTNRMNLSRVVTLLGKYGVIRCVDAAYRFTPDKDGKTKARQFVFTGPPQGTGEGAA